MLRITVELVPHGIESKKKHIGTAKIVNDNTGSLEVGNYWMTLSKFDDPNAVWKKATYKGFKRLKKGPWDLLYLLLKEAVGKRNKESKK